jgi:hypothetical protein
MITKHGSLGSTLISFGCGAVAVTLSVRGTNHFASGLHLNSIFNDGAHTVVFDIFWIGPEGNFA